MYGEYFDIPEPDEQVFISTSPAARSSAPAAAGAAGKGKVFYFRPGDQDYPVYHHPDVKRVLANAVGWARPDEVADFVAPRVVDEPTPWFSGGGLTGVGSA